MGLLALEDAPHRDRAVARDTRRASTDTALAHAVLANTELDVSVGAAAAARLKRGEAQPFELN